MKLNGWMMMAALLPLSALTSVLPQTAADLRPPSGAEADHERLVAETRQASLRVRAEALRRTIAKDTVWPSGAWGDTLWSLAALQLNEKTEDANARLLRRARDYIALQRGSGAASDFAPESAGDAPWAYFALSDYVRILYLFRDGSSRFPGRLRPETEAAMREALWFWVSKESRIADAGPEDLFLLLGTENHDLTRRPNHYLVTALLKDDPVYRDRTLADGHTAAEHAAAYTAFFREWPRSRASSGLWVEVGSDTYQKYSWPALFNLHELAPDPVIRRNFGLLLDLVFIEEAQISVRGRRGGGRSRADYSGVNGFEGYKNLLYAPAGQSAGSSHSRIIESSLYQLPAAAILLRKRVFPAAEPFVIRNRVLGELAELKAEDGGAQRLAADSALVNYAYRTPHYILGSTLQNPALTMPDPAAGGLALKYAGISRQKRYCGVLFDDPAAARGGAVCAVVEKGTGGRAQHPYWSVQHENVLLLQRIAAYRPGGLGSYSSGRLGVRFEGSDLQKVEQDGWIFATNGKAYVGVKFLDGGFQWDDSRTEVFPVNYAGPGDPTRILLHAGDVTAHGSFEQFRATLCAGSPVVTAGKVEYCFGAGRQQLEMNLYDPKNPAGFVLPRINGSPVDLRPAAAFESPYLKGEFGSGRITVTVAPVVQMIDFSEQE